mgnify:CR=1 FL=1
MRRIAFKLQLKPGCLAEYARQHDALWPEMAALIRATGVSDFRIWHDPETDALFCSQLRADDVAADAIRGHPVWQSWQAAMADLLETAPDGTARRWPLNEVFHLP